MAKKANAGSTNRFVFSFGSLLNLNKNGTYVVSMTLFLIMGLILLLLAYLSIGPKGIDFPTNTPNIPFLYTAFILLIAALSFFVFFILMGRNKRKRPTKEQKTASKRNYLVIVTRVIVVSISVLFFLNRLQSTGDTKRIQEKIENIESIIATNAERLKENKTTAINETINELNQTLSGLIADTTNPQSLNADIEKQRKIIKTLQWSVQELKKQENSIKEEYASVVSSVNQKYAELADAKHKLKIKKIRAEIVGVSDRSPDGSEINVIVSIKGIEGTMSKAYIKAYDINDERYLKVKDGNTAAEFPLNRGDASNYTFRLRNTEAKPFKKGNNIRYELCIDDEENLVYSKFM